MASTFRITLRNGGIRGPKSTKLTSQEAIGEEMAMRKAEEAASRRFEAVKWLRQMDRGAVEIPLGDLSEEEFCFALRNGLILCNVLNKVNPGAIPKVFKRVQFDNQAKLYSLSGHYFEFTHLLLCSIDISKVVDNPAVAVQLADGTAQLAIQYFENMRNFLVSVNEMKLLTFEASDLEKGGSSFKVVDCILCLKAYHEWKLAGGIGIWRYGGIVKISSSHRGFHSTLFSGASTNVSSDRSDMIHDHQLLDVLHLLAEVILKDFKVVNFLSSFDQFGVRLLETLLIECTDAGEFFLNDTLIDMVLEQAVKEFSALLVNRKNQLSVVMKKTMGEDNKGISKTTFFEGISKHFEEFWSNPPSYHDTSSDASNLDVLHFQHKQLEKLKLSFNDLKAQVERDHAKWEEDLRNFRLYIQGLELNTSSYYKLIEENRFLYNEVQDLKGCIRVYCRVRPFLTNISDERSTIDYIGENGSIIIRNPHKQGRDARKIFSFNRVFGMNSTQSEVFADTKSLIRSVLDGYNVCIFAYGQTGSGKTYTMSGANLSAAETWGVNYRALNDMFNISKSRARIVNYDVSVQMVEIYNEQVRDLLVTDGCMRSLDIRNNSQLNGLNIPDAKLFAVTCTQDVLDLMKAGLANRAVGATALNERSSRSHSVLSIHVKGKELASGFILKGCLHLVDLAGSERVEKSEVTGERLKEAQHINRSLSALGDVISALAQKSSHIPYRNSKLTQVLQDSLGGQAKTLMLVHINPEIKAFGETISTLKFAERVSSIELGASRVNKEISELRELKEEVSSLKSKLESKEMEVQKLKEYPSLADSEMHNNRAISPSNLQKCNFILNNESIQRPLRNPGVIEFSSSSSGNQRKPHFGMTFLNKESMVKDLASRSPLSAGDSCMISRKIRSPSPPIRRSTSTDRASIIKTKTRIQTISGRPLQKLQFPEPITINKSTASVSRESTSDLYIHKYLQEQGTSRRILHESDDQSRQALAIRKNKMDSKFKYQREPQKSDINYGVIAENIQLSETEMNFGLTNSLTGSAKVRKFQSVVARISKTMESRISIEEGEKFPRGKHENKPPNYLAQNGKEGISCNPKSELRRSRSLPRGKFMFS